MTERPSDLPEALQFVADLLDGVHEPHAVRMFAATAIRTEHAQRITLQHHAADMAQRVADLEAERDELRARLAEREPVRLKEGAIEEAIYGHARWDGDFWAVEDADWMPMHRSLEVAVLKANRLGDGDE